MSIKNEITVRSELNRRLTITEVDDNNKTVVAMAQSSNNSVTYYGPDPSGLTVSSVDVRTTTLLQPKSQRFTGIVPPSSYNSVGTSTFYLYDGMTFSFRFSATASYGGTVSNVSSWWQTLQSNYANKVLTLSDTSYPTGFEFTINSLTHTQSQTIWNVIATKISGPTISSINSGSTTRFSKNSGFLVGYKSIAPPNSSLTYGWSASIPMSGRNFPLTIGTMSPNVVSNSNYIVRVTSASVQFIGVTGVGSQVNPLFGINLNADLPIDSYTETLATATFSGTYTQNRTYRLRPTNLIMDGDSVLTLTGTTYSTWGGITFSSSNNSRIAIFLTYTLFQNLYTGFDPVV